MTATEGAAVATELLDQTHADLAPMLDKVADAVSSSIESADVNLDKVGNKLRRNATTLVKRAESAMLPVLDNLDGNIAGSLAESQSLIDATCPAGMVKGADGVCRWPLPPAQGGQLGGDLGGAGPGDGFPPPPAQVETGFHTLKPDCRIANPSFGPFNPAQAPDNMFYLLGVSYGATGTYPEHCEWSWGAKWFDLPAELLWTPDQIRNYVNGLDRERFLQVPSIIIGRPITIGPWPSYDAMTAEWHELAQMACCATTYSSGGGGGGGGIVCTPPQVLGADGKCHDTIPPSGGECPPCPPCPPPPKVPDVCCPPVDPFRDYEWFRWGSVDPKYRQIALQFLGDAFPSDLTLAGMVDSASPGLPSNGDDLPLQNPLPT